MNIKRSLVWLVRHQEKDGNLAKDCICPMYSHGIAAAALSRALDSATTATWHHRQDAVDYIIGAR